MAPTCWIGKGQGDGAEIVRRHAHIAVADDEDVVRGCSLHPLHGDDLVVDVVGLAAGGKELRRNVRIACGDAAGDLQAGIRKVARAEEDFVLRIILPEKSIEVGFEIGSAPCSGLNRVSGGVKPGRSASLARAARRSRRYCGTADQHHAGEDR